MRYCLLLVLGLLVGSSVFAQHPTCGGGRYTTPIFAGYDSTMNVKFGENTTYGGTFQELFMDIYEPTGDVATERPVVVLAFGGAFIAGQREDVAGLCKTFARAGYVSATIDYRLFDNFLFTDSTQAIDAVVKAVSDMKAAIRYLRENAATYGIDTNFVFVGGVSAGAIAASHVAYLEPSDNPPAYAMTAINNNGGFEGNSSSNYQYSSRVSGVLNWSGALKDASWIDADDPPLYSAHDDADNVVPYSSYSVQIGFNTTIYLEGSATMKTVADGLGIPNGIFVIPNSANHVSYLNNTAQLTQIVSESALMMHDVLCNPSVGVSTPESEVVDLYPNPAGEFVRLDHDGPVRLSLYDLSGRKLSEEVFSGSGVEQVARPAAGAGCYIARIHDLNQDRDLTPRKLIFR